MTKLVSKSQLREVLILMLYYASCALVCASIVVGSMLIVLSDQLYNPINGWVTLVLLGGNVCTVLWMLKAISKLEVEFDYWRKLRRRYKKQFRKLRELEPKDFIT